MMRTKPPIRTPQAEWKRVQHVQQQVVSLYQVPASDVSIVRAPLRICPLGAHIDHQLGVVTGMTINQSLLLGFAPTTDGSVRVHSSDFDSPVSFQIDDIPPFAPHDWGNYIRGAALALKQEHSISQGVVGYVDSDMPVGGLSSSAAVTVAYLMALESANGLNKTPLENVALVSHTEQRYIGLQNGILDQTSILFSVADCLTRIDCQSQEITRIRSGDNLAPFEIMVIYSGVSQNLVGSGYNRRVAECQEAAKVLLEQNGQCTADPRLRMVDPALFEAEGHRIPEIPRRRAAHYFSEMARVEAGVEAWQAGDITRFGDLMNLSGESSVHQYECGCPQLITLYETLRKIPGVLGTRFSGAGFRGNCIAFIEPSARESVAEQLHSVYPIRHEQQADAYSIHFCRPAGPATLLAFN